MRKNDNFKFGFLSNTENCKHACFSVSQGLRSDSFSHWIWNEQKYSSNAVTFHHTVNFTATCLIFIYAYLSCLVNAEYFWFEVSFAFCMLQGHGDWVLVIWYMLTETN